MPGITAMPGPNAHPCGLRRGPSINRYHGRHLDPGARLDGERAGGPRSSECRASAIALSIVFVAVENLLKWEMKKRWIITLLFGLIHGFGFAGALSEVGLPQGHIPAALFFFNVGVEIGQIVFIAVVLAVITISRRIPLRVPRWAELIPPYAIGSVAMFWVIQRVVAF